MRKVGTVSERDGSENRHVPGTRARRRRRAPGLAYPLPPPLHGFKPHGRIRTLVLFPLIHSLPDGRQARRHSVPQSPKAVSTAPIWPPPQVSRTIVTSRGIVVRAPIWIALKMYSGKTPYETTFRPVLTASATGATYR